MKELAVRLKKGADLKASIEEICLKNEVSCAVILSGVGCLYEAQIRLAGATEVLEFKEDLEIVSLTGTIAAGKSHIHISLADEKVKMIRPGPPHFFDTLRRKQAVWNHQDRQQE